MALPAFLGHEPMGARAVLTASSQEDTGHERSGHGKAGGRGFLGVLLHEGSLLSQIGAGVSPALRFLLLLAERDDRQVEASVFSVNTAITASCNGSASSLNSLRPLAYPGCTINAMKRPLLPWAQQGVGRSLRLTTGSEAQFILWLAQGGL